MDEIFTLAADGGSYWPGLIIPAVIVIVGLLTAAVVLLVTREPRGVAPPEPSVSIRPSAAAEPETEEAPEEPGEDE